MYKFTVIWGNIGDCNMRRFDHVEVAERTFTAVMDAAFRIVWDEGFREESPEQSYDLFRLATPYDGFAILDGHIYESAHVNFS